MAKKGKITDGDNISISWFWNPIAISIYVLIMVAAFVICVTGFKIQIIKPDFIWGFYNKTFLKGVLVEAHGMLLDILIISVLMQILNKLTEKRLANQRYLEEIRDFKCWDDKEARFKNTGNLNRLMKNGYKKEIDLSDCYLGNDVLQPPSFVTKLDGIVTEYIGFSKQAAILEYFSKSLAGINLENAQLWSARLTGADLRGANLRGTILRGAKLRKATLLAAKLQGADLWKADLQEANLWGAEGLTIEQLCKAETLYEAKLDPELMEQVKEECPRLLEKP